MARKKKVVASAPKSLAIKEQVAWLHAHKDNNLYVEVPGHTSILDIFTMLDNVPLTFRAGDDRLESCAGAYKQFLMDANPPLYATLQASAASIL